MSAPAAQQAACYVTVGPQPSGSLNLSASRDKIHSNFDSVQEQTGLFAGKGGYQVKVGEHTQLDGAVIASTVDKDKTPSIPVLSVLAI
uniref:hypothetical protein n=1 Tax=Photorhabdus sp. CRCIA-P01 TaxID=2019570 RepID=UPI001E5B7763|nr:hypothetical protein [Photorhabdus sp. CRCIA-P01]